MSYEPLHHKYRPQTFADLVGQDAIATTLTNAIRTEKIAPAYLFTGPRGTGKTSSARILAKSLNCLKSDKPTALPCGVCEVCQGIAKGSALDVIEIDAASNTGVDHIRELIERAQFAPVQCRYKVYVVDECHMLSVAAFNALLKTLEEPPDRVVFVLATTDPQRVLPTIISRCQRFDFRRIPLEAMVAHLSAIASKENINITHEAVQLVAQVAQGGLRDAESLLDQLSLLSGQVTVERVWDLVGSCSEPDLMELLQAIAQNNPETVLDCTRKVMDRGREPLTVLQNLAGFYRDLLIAKTAPKRSDLVAITPPTWKALCELARLWDVPTILTGQKHLKESEVQIKNTTQPRLWLEVTLLGLLIPATKETQPKPADVVAPASQPISAQTPTPEPLPTPPAPPEQPTPTSVKSISTPNSPPPATLEPTASDAGSDIWQQVIDLIQPPATQALVSQQCRLLAFDGAVAQISINSKPLLKLAQGKLPNIEAAFQKLLQKKVKVSLELATPTQTKTGGVNEEPRRSPLPQASPTTGSAPASSPQVSDPVKSHLPTNSSSQAHAQSQLQAEMTVQTQPQPPDPISESPTMGVATTYAPTTTAQSEQDEVVSVAQRLAKAFNGEVLKLNLDPAFPPSETTNSLPSSLDDWHDADAEGEADIDF